MLINTSGCHASASLAAVQRASDRASYSRFPSRPGKDTRKWRRSPSLTIELNARTGWTARRQLGCGGSALLHACSPRAVHLQGVSSYILVVNMPYTEAHPLKRPLSCVSRLQLCVQNGSHLRRSAPSELLRALAPPYGNRLRRSARRAGPARLALGAARLRGYLDHWMLRLRPDGGGERGAWHHNSGHCLRAKLQVRSAHNDALRSLPTAVHSTPSPQPPPCSRGVQAEFEETVCHTVL